MVSILTALYFDALQAQDRVAVKPHASPAFHAIQYLLGKQTLDKLQNFRAFGGRGMKAADFDYVRAGSVAETCRLLKDASGDGKIIAGGQTLVPMLAMRLAKPTLIIDIANIAELSGIEEAAGAIVIRAATRQADALAHDLVRRRVPLLAKALALVGHTQTRDRKSTRLNSSH